MFSPLIAKAHTKAAESSAHSRSRHSSFASTHRFGDGKYQQPHNAVGMAGSSHRFDFSRIPIHPPTESDKQSRGGDLQGEVKGKALGGDPTPAAPTPAAPSPPANAPASPAKSISTSNLSAPDWADFGEFKWWVKWITDGKSGWIVQHLTNTYSGSLADGSSLTDQKLGLEPSYYEAWEVAADGTITGSLGGTFNRDRWERPHLEGSTGSWSMVSTVHWTPTDPQKSGFASGSVPAAGSLLSSKTAPADLSASLFNRGAYGAWDSTGKPLLPGCFVS